MQCLVSVSFRMIQPVTQSVWVTLVNTADSNVYVETFVNFFFTNFWFKDNSYGKNIIDFLKCYVLVLHLIPNRIRAFYASLNFVFQSNLVKSFAYRICEKSE